ncbi:hypothetical protein HFO56_02865 [Rhizobium laguerreae]|uniref:hypothetical protein n=1 Tax=Rhizobium laguerreae TaxID=1076926 RepID=UPI001C91B7C5|nr:hypothetical protein [Rhizobium laguerreae]MBY3151328.1 hypothetical protein [Rhizobium laguerreae]
MPPALQHVVMAAAGGVALIASGAIAVSPGWKGSDPSLFLLVCGVFYGGLGVSLYWKESRKPWNASAYAGAIASANEDREGRIRTRVVGLVIGIVMIVSALGFVDSGQAEQAEIPLLMAVLFLTMTLSEYCRAAEPPNPDEGDRSARSVSSLG